MRKKYNFKKTVSHLEDELEYKTEEKRNIVELINAGVMCREIENNNEAISCFDKVLVIDPNDILALVNKGGVLVEMQKYDESLPILDKAIELRPELADAHYNKAAALAMTGNVEESLSCLDKAVKINPDFAAIARDDKDFLYIKEFPGFSAIVD